MPMSAEISQIQGAAVLRANDDKQWQGEIYSGPKRWDSENNKEGPGSNKMNGSNDRVGGYNIDNGGIDTMDGSFNNEINNEPSKINESIDKKNNSNIDESKYDNSIKNGNLINFSPTNPNNVKFTPTNPNNTNFNPTNPNNTNSNPTNPNNTNSSPTKYNPTTLVNVSGFRKDKAAKTGSRIVPITSPRSSNDKTEDFNKRTSENRNKTEKTETEFPDEYYYDTQDIDVYRLFVQPRYLKITRRSKFKTSFFKRLFLAQEVDTVQDEEQAVWCMKFSPDGRYVAAGGKDSVIRVYKVISSPLDRLEYEHSRLDHDVREHGPNYTLETQQSIDYAKDSVRYDTMSDSESKKTSSGGATTLDDTVRSSKKAQGKKGALYAPLFHDTPYRIYVGHTQDILSLDWSKNNFLLSSSMDRTVRLWHVESSNCLQVFRHTDFVTCAKFHPTDDRFFVSGSLDKKIRLWSILDGEVSFCQNVPSMITACEFYPNGDVVVVGTINGLVYSFETKGLHMRNHFDLKKTYIKNSSGAKVSGLECFETEPNGKGVTDIRLLITTNDSRIRLYSCTQKKLLMKFKGLQNRSSQAVAVTADNHNLVLCASEDHMVYMWQVNDPEVLRKVQTKKSINIFKKPTVANLQNDTPMLGDDDLPENIKNSNYYAFHAHDSCVTSALFVPQKTKKWLYLSNDPIYDLNRTFSEIIESGGSNIALSPTKSSEEDTAREFKEVSNFLSRILSRSSTSSDDSQERHSSAEFSNDKAISSLKNASLNDYITLLKNYKSQGKGNIDTVLSLLDPMQLQIAVSADQKGKIRVFRIDSAYQIRKILQEDIVNHTNATGLKKHSHTAHECPRVFLNAFVKKLNGYEDYLVDHRMNTLNVDDGNITNAYTSRRKLRNKAKSFKKKLPNTNHSSPVDDARNSIQPLSLNNNFNYNSDIIDDNLATVNNSSQVNDKSMITNHTTTLKDLIAEQNNAIYSDIKNTLQNEDRSVGMKKNNSFYSISNGSASLSSLIHRGRSGSSKPMCDVCQGTKFYAKKIQYKNVSQVARICQDCGNQISP